MSRSSVPRPLQAQPWVTSAVGSCVSRRAATPSRHSSIYSESSSVAAAHAASAAASQLAAARLLVQMVPAEVADLPAQKPKSNEQHVQVPATQWHSWLPSKQQLNGHAQCRDQLHASAVQDHASTWQPHNPQAGYAVQASNCANAVAAVQPVSHETSMHHHAHAIGRNSTSSRCRCSSCNRGEATSSSLLIHEPLKYHITVKIKRCRCSHELDAVVREYGPAFNIIHISAAITHLAQLQSRLQHLQQKQQQWRLNPNGQQQQQQQQQQQAVGLQAITAQMAQQHHALHENLAAHQQQQQWLQAPTAAVSQPKLQHRMLQDQPQSTHDYQQQFSLAGDLVLLQQLLQQVTYHLHEAQSRQVANMMWAVAQLQARGCLQPDMSAAVMAIANRAAQLFDTANQQHLSNMAYAAAKLQLPVSSTWLAGLQQAWLGHVQQCIRLNSKGPDSNSSSHPTEDSAQFLHPQACVNMLWALVSLQQQPSSAWLQQTIAAAAPNLAAWPPKSAALLVWGCAKLGYQVNPSQHDQCNLAGAAQTKYKQDQPQQQQQAGQPLQLRSSQRLPWQQHLQCQHHWQSQHQHHQQEQHLPSLFLRALQLHAHAFSLQDMSQALWGAAVMGLQLPEPCLQQLLAAGAQHLPVLQPPQPCFVKQQQQQLEQARAKGMQESHISGVKRANSSANVLLNADAGATAHSISMMLWSLARLRVLPRQQLPPQLLEPWLLALLASCSQADCQSMAVAAWALTRLQLVHSCPGVLLGMLQAAQQRVELQQSHVTATLPAVLLWAAAHCHAAAISEQVKQLERRKLHLQPGVNAQQQQQFSILAATDAKQQHSAALEAAYDRSAGSTKLKSRTLLKAAISDACQQLLVSTAGCHDQQGAAAVQQPQHHAGQVSAQTAVPGASWLDMSQLLWAVAQLQLALPQQWWCRCLSQLQQMLTQLQAQYRQPQSEQHISSKHTADSLAMSVWALGKARAMVPQGFMHAVQQVTMQFLHQEQQSGVRHQPLSPQGHVLLLVGLTRLYTTAAHQLPSLKSRHQGHHTCKQRQLCSAKASNIAGTQLQPGKEQSQQQQQQRNAISLNYQHSGQQQQQLGLSWNQPAAWCPIDTQWLAAYCQFVACELPKLQPVGLVALLWAFGRLRYHPGASFMATALHQVELQLCLLGTRHIAVLLWSLARLQHVPSDHLLQDLLQVWEQQLASTNKADNQQLAWAQQQLQLLQQQRSVNSN